MLKKIFILYVIVLSIALLFKFHLSADYIMDKVNAVKLSRESGAWNINLIPFATISAQLGLFKHIPAVAVKNLVGNIALFVPFGILFPMGYRTMAQFRRTFLAGLVYILIIELIQFIGMLGAFDVDDIMLNVMGVACGYVIFRLISKIRTQRGRRI